MRCKMVVSDIVAIVLDRLQDEDTDILDSALELITKHGKITVHSAIQKLTETQRIYVARWLSPI